MGGTKKARFKKVYSKSETVVLSVCTFSKSNSTCDIHNLDNSALYKKVCNKMATTTQNIFFTYIYIYMKYMSINFKIHLHLPLDTEL